MFDFFLKRQHRDELSCIFAIESGEICSALVEYKKGQKPFIHHISYHAIDNHSFDTNRLIPLMLSSLHRSSEHLIKSAFKNLKNKKIKVKNLKNIYVFFGSPWHISETLTTKKEENLPFFVTQNLLNTLARGENKPDSPVTVIEELITSIKSNGYTLKSPLHKKVSSIEVSSFVSHIDKTLISDIKNTLDLTFPGITTVFHTMGSALFTCVKNVLKKEDVLMIIPEHEMTEITLVRNNKIKNNVSLPLGKHQIINKIQELSKLNRRLAVSIFDMYQQNKLNEKKLAEMDAVLEEAKQDFIKCFLEALSKITTESILPSNIVITDNSPESLIIKNWIESNTELVKLFSSPKPDIVCLNEDKLLSMLDISSNTIKNLQKNPNAEILSLAIFINLI